MRYVILLIILFPQFLLPAQQNIKLELKVINLEERRPIADVHVFLRGSSLGRFSDENGFVQLQIPRKATVDLVLSHLNYETRIIPFHEYRRYATDSTKQILLKPRVQNLSEVTITSEPSRLRRKQLKRFREAFIGSGEASKECTITNPEVLRFSETKDTLFAFARSPLQMENNFLGYSITFYLKEFKAWSGGGVKYRGPASFESYEKDRLEDFHLWNRQTTYANSPEHFLRELLKNPEVEDHEYQSVEVLGGELTPRITPLWSEMVHYDSLLHYFQIRLHNFLEITHLNEAELIDTDISGFKSAQGSPGYHNTQSLETSQKQYKKSWLHVKGSVLWLDEFGRLLNEDDIEEYGFWARQRMALQLPIDYNLETISESNDYLTWLSDTLNLSMLVDPLLRGDAFQRSYLLQKVRQTWNNTYAAPMLELAHMSRDSNLINPLRALLYEHYGPQFNNYFDGLQALWKKDPSYGAEYPDFKAQLYKYVDTSFYAYFKGRHGLNEIRWDEIVWGGVKQNGIPPLSFPDLMQAQDAMYLDDEDVVFGLEIDGHARAYPKRILGWHEMAHDTLGGKHVALVYCTLCGTVIPFETTIGETSYELGTSGFLYRSNKLMFDRLTHSLWSTLTGQPVVGPLINDNLQLEFLPVVTTTWGKWRDSHPGTLVLDIDTGYERDYSEGEAYNAYFSTDQLMFPVPHHSRSLKNKSEILAVRHNALNKPLAVDIKWLEQNPFWIYPFENGQLLFVTDEGGTRVFLERKDNQGSTTKTSMTFSENEDNWEDVISPWQLQELERIPVHRVFWFAWFNQFPHTILLPEG